MMSLRVCLVVAMILCLESVTSLQIYKEVKPSCMVETDRGMLDLRPSAHWDGYKAAFEANELGQKDVETHWNPCVDTQIPSLMCSNKGQVFQTDLYVKNCETLARAADSHFSVRNDQLELNYRNYVEGTDIHIAMNCSAAVPSDPFYNTVDCWDKGGDCYVFTHPDACLKKIDMPVDIIVSSAVTLSSGAVLLLTLAALLVRN